MKKLFVLAVTLVVFGCGDDITISEPLHEVQVVIKSTVPFSVLVTSDGVPVLEITRPGTSVIIGNTVCVTGQTIPTTFDIEFSIQVAGNKVETMVPEETISICNQ